MAVETRPELVGKRFLCVGGGGEEPPESGRWRAGVIRAVSQRDSRSPDLAVRAARVPGPGRAGPGGCGGAEDGGAGPAAAAGRKAGRPGRARRDTALRLGCGGCGGERSGGGERLTWSPHRRGSGPGRGAFPRGVCGRGVGGRGRRRRRRSPSVPPRKARLRLLAVQPPAAASAVGGGRIPALATAGEKNRSGAGGAELGLGANASVPGECRNCRHVALTDRI